MSCGCSECNKKYGGIQRPPLSYKAGGKSPKASMSCGQVKRSTRPGKKIMKLYCIDGKKKLVHAGAKGYGHNYSAAARKSFKARHKCSTAKPGTAKHLACTELWAGKGGSKKSSPKGRKGKYAVGGPYLNINPYNPLNESNFDVLYKNKSQGEMDLSGRQQRRIKRRQTGRNIGATAYGVLEGLVDTLSFGATDAITDKGYEALAGLGRGQSESRRAQSDRYRVAGQIGSGVLTGIATGGATVGPSFGTTDWGTLANEKSQGLQTGLNIAGTVAGVATGNINAAGDMGALSNTTVGDISTMLSQNSSFGGTGTASENLAQTYAPNLKEGISGFQDFKELNPDSNLGDFLKENPEILQKALEGLGMGSGAQVNKYGGPISYRAGGHRYQTGGPTDPPKGGNMLPTVEISTLSNDSYNNLSQPEKFVYDRFGNNQTLPYYLKTKAPTTRGLFNLEKRDALHWEDALRMVRDSGVKHIYDTPSEWALQNPVKYKIKEGSPFFRAHARNGSIYVPPTPDPLKQELDYQNFKEQIEKQKNNGVIGDFDNMLQERKRMMGNIQLAPIPAELAHLNLRRYLNENNNFWQKIGLQRSNYGILEQQTRKSREARKKNWYDDTDVSNYSALDDLEYKTHFDPTGAEARQFQEYNLTNRLKQKFAGGGPILQKAYAPGGPKKNPTDPPRKSIINRNVDISPQRYYSVAESTGTQTPVFRSKEDVQAPAQSRFFSQVVQEADRVAAITGDEPNYEQAKETVTTGKQPTFVTNPDDPEYQERAKAYREKYGINISEPTLIERLASPMAQLEYYNRYGSFPNRAQMDLAPTYGNPLDIPLAIYNPASYIQSGVYAADAASKGNYGEAALNSLGVIPGYYGFKLAGKYAPTASKFLTTQTPLKDAYKINPWAFKPKPNSFYRQVDDETFREGLESGFIKGKQNIGYRGPESGSFNLNKSFGDDAYYNKGSLYYKDNKNLPYLFEANLPEEKFIPKVNNRTRGYTADNTSVRVSREPLPITDPNITTYRRHWLRGYKPVEVPKYNTPQGTAAVSESEPKVIISPDFRYGGGLRRWFKEEWKDVKTGEPCGRKSASDSSRPYPYCRPSRTVSSETPATSKHPKAKSRAKQKTGPSRVKPIS